MSTFSPLTHTNQLRKAINANEKTVDVYNRTIEHYLAHTPKWYNESHTPLLNWIDFSLSLIPFKSTILEIGSGPGRDAHYMRRKGFHVVASDASYAFVDYLTRNSKERALHLDVVKDSIEGKYNMIFANAVVPHFTEEDLRKVLLKIREALNEGGVFAFSAKQGEGESWVDEKLGEKRYIRYWRPDTLVELTNATGYELAYIDSNIPGDLPTHTWTLITAKK